MKTIIKNFLLATVLWIFLFATACFSQTIDGAIMVGQGCAEISGSYTMEEGLILGISVSNVDSELVQKRANKNDVYSSNVYKLNSSLTPAVFSLIGGQFDDLSLIGKLGTAYINQDVNGKLDSKKLYFAVGMIFDYKISQVVSVRASYDNVNGAMVGTSFHFKL